MENEEYQSLVNLLSATQLKDFYRDVSLFNRRHEERSETSPDISDKSCVMIGDLVHKVLLEKKSVEELVSFYPADCLKKNGSLNPKPASAFREYSKAQGKVVVKDNDFKRIVGCCNSVLGHTLGTLIEMDGIEFEKPVFWTDHGTGIACRCKPDFMYVGESHVVCYDLKVTESVAPSKWERVAKNMLYWLQDAHYSSGLAHVHEKPVRFVFWVVESVAPHRIVQYLFDPISRERGSESYVALLGDLKNRRSLGDWSEDWEDKPNLLSLNPWDLKNLEEELEGFSA